MDSIPSTVTSTTPTTTPTLSESSVLGSPVISGIGASTVKIETNIRNEQQSKIDDTFVKYRDAILRLNEIKTTTDEIEMKKLLQELNSKMDTYLNNKEHQFFESCLQPILNYLSYGSKNYIKEHNHSQIRQLVLEFLSRFPLVVTRSSLHQMFPVFYNIMETDNEDNACLALRIVFDIHRRIPKMIDEAKKVFNLAKKFIMSCIQNSSKILKQYKQYHVRSMEELDLEPILQEIFVSTSLEYKQDDSQKNINCFTLLPRGINSLKLMIDLPLNVILLIQIYRTALEPEYIDLLNLGFKLLAIQPSDEQKSHDQFNLDVYIDFLMIQIKHLSFISFLMRNQEEKLTQYIDGEQLPLIVLSLLKNIPDDMINLRKDLLLSCRYILSTKFRSYFVSHVTDFFDEKTLIGDSWNTRDLVRPLAYSVVFDLIHQTRDSMSIKELTIALNLYSKNFYEDNPPASVMIMTCRVIFNIVDSFSKSANRENWTGVIQLLVKVLEMITDKIESMVEFMMPSMKSKILAAKSKSSPLTNDIGKETLNFNDKRSNYKSKTEYVCASFIETDDVRYQFSFPESQNYFTDFRTLSKTLINGMKILSTKLTDIHTRIQDCNIQQNAISIVNYKTGYCRPRDIDIIVRFLKNGIKVLEVYNSNLFPTPPNRQIQTAAQMQQNLHIRAKEEKEIIESFSAVFTCLPTQTFRVIIKDSIDFIINAIIENPNIQQLVNCFLSNKNTSSVFADTLTFYLVERMEVMGKNTELSNLYLKLFKSVFGSVSCFKYENEKMLQSHLKKLVKNSMEMAINAQEPYNYFMLLRALFRSIGGGTHDQLYREFLPMLPTLLQGLNRFQTGIHRQNMKDLFVELCLTIPNRINAIIVENIEQNENIASVSLRILGKLGGTNHRMMIEPQKLTYYDSHRESSMYEDESFLDKENSEQSSSLNIPSHGSCAYIEIEFADSKFSLNMPVDRCIAAAYKYLRSPTTDPFYRQHCWELVKGFLSANIQRFISKDDQEHLEKLFSHPAFTSGTEFGYPSSIAPNLSSSFSKINFYKFCDEKLRKVHEQALIAMLTASAIKELTVNVLKFMVSLTRTYTLVAICQQSGPIHTSGRIVKLHGMDPLVLIDALTSTMGQEEQELGKPCRFLICIIIDTAVTILGSKERACQLPLFEYMLNKVCLLCYERAWYSKYGGCVTVRYIFDRMSLRWLLNHQLTIVKAMFFVMMDLAGDLSIGVIETAKDNLETMIKICCPSPNTPKESDLIDLQQKSMNEVTQELLRQVTHSNTTVRQQAMHLLSVMAKTSDCSVADIIEPHKILLADMVPFKKHKLFHQPFHVQIGILEGITFFISLEPQLFVIDLENVDHQCFFNDLISICENDDAQLGKLSCYKHYITQLPQLRKAALRMLSACQYLQSMSNKIFDVLYKALTSSDIELQDCAYDCMKKYKYIQDINPDLIRKTVRGFLMTISELKVLTAKDHLLILKLKNLARLYTFLFNDKLCEHMLQQLNRLIENCGNILRKHRDREYEMRMKAQQNQNVENTASSLSFDVESILPANLNIAAEIIYLFCEISAAESTYVKVLLNLLNQTELFLDIYVAKTFYKPIQCFMKRYTKISIAQFQANLNTESIFPILYTSPSIIIEMLNTKLSSTPIQSIPLTTTATQSPQNVPTPGMNIDVTSSSPNSPSFIASQSSVNHSRYQAIKVISILIKHDPKWISSQGELVKVLKTLWLSDSFHIGQDNFLIDYQQWEEPRLLAQCLLCYLEDNIDEIEFFFQMLKAFLHLYLCSFEFLKKFFITTIPETYDIDWKKRSFLKYFELFPVTRTICPKSDCCLEWSQNLKAKILQLMIIPIFNQAIKSSKLKEFLQLPKDYEIPPFSPAYNFQPNLVSIFLNVLANDPKTSDGLQMFVIQLGCLIIEHASEYVRPLQKQEQNENSSRVLMQYDPVRILMQYAWPDVIQASKRQDSMKKFVCNLLFCHIISKNKIIKRLIKPVLCNLFKVCSSESRNVIFNALEILIPVLPQRLKEGYRTLRNLTKKLLFEEVHSTAQTNHLLQIIIRYYRIFYPTRHNYIQYMISSIQRLAFSANGTFDHRKMALDLIEVIIRWEHERISSEQMDRSDDDSSGSECSYDSKQDQQSQSMQSSSKSSAGLQSQETQSNECISTAAQQQQQQLNSAQQVAQSNLAASNEFLSRRAQSLLKDILQNEFWPLKDIKLTLLERILMTVKDNSSGNICQALELIILFLDTMKRDVIIQLLSPLQRAISACCTSTNPKIVSTVHNLLTKLMAIVPPSGLSSTIFPESGQPVRAVNQTLETFEQLYTDIHSIILNGLASYNKIGQPLNDQSIVTGPLQGPNAQNLQFQHQLMSNVLNRSSGGGTPGAPVHMMNSTTTTLSQLFSVLMCLKAACVNKPMYIDRLATPFSTMFQKLVKEHTGSANNSNQTSDLMNILNNVFLTLIDKTTDVKVMRTLLKMVEDWIKQPSLSSAQCKANPSITTSAPGFRDKTMMIIRVGVNINQRFPNEIDLNIQFLELVYYIYSDDQLKSSDIASKLESAFMSGLRCSQPELRQKFFTLLDNCLRKSVADRLLYIIINQNWEAIGAHFWIKQAIELILSVSDDSKIISSPNKNALIPLPTALVPNNDHQDKSLLSGFVSNGIDYLSSMTIIDPSINLDLFGIGNTTNLQSSSTSSSSNGVDSLMEIDPSNEHVNDLFKDQNSTSNSAANSESSKSTSTTNSKQNICKIACEFLNENATYKSSTFYHALSQLCHLDNDLAYHIWIQLFPRIYSILNDHQRTIVSLELPGFLLSGAHAQQRDIQQTKISVVGTFFEAISYCNPPIIFRPQIIRYLSKYNYVWHRGCLILEEEIDSSNNMNPVTAIGGLVTNNIGQQANLNFSNYFSKQNRSFISNSEKNALACNLPANLDDLFPSELPSSLSQPYYHECLSALADICETLKESDYWSGIWCKKAQYKETLMAIAYEQQGYFEQAKGAYELAMSKASNDYSTAPSPPWLKEEFTLWEQHWIRCSKELNQWDFLLEYATNRESLNPLLILESAWRIPDWNAMAQGLILVEHNLFKDFAWRLALYKGYNAICNLNNRDFALAERMIEFSSQFLVKEWRRLPHIVSSAHITILQGAHQVIELQEALNVHQILFNHNGMYSSERLNGDIRCLIKTWKNRLPDFTDDLSHWSDIFTWRQHHYQAIVTKSEQDNLLQAQQQQSNASNVTSALALCGAHASAQSLIHLAKIARQNFLINVALDQLSRIHTIPKVPIIDCYHKIRQQLKCYLLKHSIQPTGDFKELHEAMSVVECTQLSFFQADTKAEFIALKGHILSKMKRTEEADKNLSIALQIHDQSAKCWAMWAEFYYELFMDSVNESFSQRDLKHGSNAVIAYLQASRQMLETKVRKYLARVLWLLSYDKNDYFADIIEKFNAGLSPSHWIPWVQQLLQCLVRSKSQTFLNIISQMSKFYPEAVYYPTRTTYLALKCEQRDIAFKIAYCRGSGPKAEMPVSNGLWRCTKIMHFQRELHPTLLTSIEGIIDQFPWFRENSSEEILRQLRQALAKCYTLAFENRKNVAETVATQPILNYIRKMTNTFGTGIDGIVSGNSNVLNESKNLNATNAKRSQSSFTEKTTTAASETLARRAQSTVQDPDFQKMKQQFANDFDFKMKGSKKLHQIIGKLKKWIKILEAKTRLLPKSWLLEEKCRYLSNFSQSICNVSLPGEHYLPTNNTSGAVHIARFMPKVELVSKHNTIARRLYIRGENGKIYPYLVLSDSSITDLRNEERFLHLLRLLNHYMTKHKETSRRVLNFTVPKILAISTQMRLVEDNVSSLSLIEIYKQHMIRRGSDPDAPIAKYYDQLLSSQTKGLQVSPAQLKEIIEDIQSSMAPRTLLKEWALNTYASATDFWHFRKLFTLQLGLAGLSEFVFHLTRLNPDMMYIHRDSGLMNIAYYRFDFIEEKGELNSFKTIPFRITNSIQNLLTDIGIRGPLTQTMIATSSCLTHPNYKIRSIILAIFRDEIINWYKRTKINENLASLSSAIQAAKSVNAAAAAAAATANDPNNEHCDEIKDQDQTQRLQSMMDEKLLSIVEKNLDLREPPQIPEKELVTLTTKAVNSIMSRLQNLATFEGIDSNVAKLIDTAMSQENLCQMDPAWHPWL
ncbi:Transformation/transcription domain-associated protein [Sarcoptes scabiei]|uniref:Transformation/transcription domain-associated protein n=1 Tax=Sarcoptes scabiei TaxID=52283 RepID=A0A834R4K9_SARSC|nr:Transformation/transcription domain-associated protein [Sarcoptes scabiei]